MADGKAQNLFPKAYASARSNDEGGGGRIEA